MSPFQCTTTYRAQAIGLSKSGHSSKLSRDELIALKPKAEVIHKEGLNMLTKNQVIDAICRLNPTAPMHWLASFDLAALREYYEHLLITLEPRGSRGWVRSSDTPAIVTRKPAA